MSATSPKLSGIGRLRIGVENEWHDETSTYRYVKSTGVDLSGLEAGLLEDTQQRMADYSLAGVPGPKVGTVTTTHFIAGWSDSTPAGPPAFDDEFAATSGTTTTGYHMLLSAIGSAVGNITAGGFSDTVDHSASTTSVIKSNTLDGSGGGTNDVFDVGQPVVWENANAYTMGWATNVDVAAGPPMELTLLQTVAADEVPAAGSKLHGAYTAFQTTGSVYHEIQHDGANEITSYSLEWLGHGSDDKVVMTGCMPTSFTMDFATGELPTMSVTWSVSFWEESGSGGLGGAAVSETWAEPLPEAVLSGWVAKGASAATSMRISSLSVDVQLARPAIADPSTDGGIGGFGPTLRKPTVTFSVFRDFTEEVADFLNQTGDIYTFRFGSEPGKMIGICIPNGRVVSLPTRGESDGAITSEVEVVACEYSSDTGALPADGTTIIDSDFRIGFC